ncbi:MAG TPA: macro domain-containing protein [Gemmatimonadales bacterium]|nr:macro domain-containing protein [Gemmatimonadales bacterium]
MIQVAVDDLAFAEVDAVVRPADTALDPVTTGAARLDRQAGERFTAQRRIQTPLAPGAAVVTGGGDLPAKLVVHAVIQSRDQPVSADSVRRALVSVWQRMAQWQIRTVAMPVVGAGAGQLPIEEAARLLRETLADPARDPAFPASVTVMVDRESERELVAAAVLPRAAM